MRPTPWHLVESYDGLADVFDATGAFICPMPIEIAKEVVGRSKPLVVITHPPGVMNFPNGEAISCHDVARQIGEEIVNSNTPLAVCVPTGWRVQLISNSLTVTDYRLVEFQSGDTDVPSGPSSDL